VAKNILMLVLPVQFSLLSVTKISRFGKEYLFYCFFERPRNILFLRKTDRCPHHYELFNKRKISVPLSVCSFTYLFVWWSVSPSVYLYQRGFHWRHLREPWYWGRL